MNKEFLHMQKLAGIITESEYKEKLQTVREEEGVDDVDDPKLDKIEDKVKSELDKNEDLKKLAIKAIKSLHKDTGLSLSDMKDREKVFNTLVSLNEISADQISKTTAALFTALSTGSGAIGAAMKIVGGVGADPQANASLIMAALAAGIAAYFWNYSKRVDKNP
jgi:hypothetical protein